MNERHAHDLILIRAIEQSDAQELVLTRDDRQWATQAALDQPGSTANKQARKSAFSQGEESFLARRAALARTQLESRHPQIVHAYVRTGWPGWMTWALPIVALVLGAASNELAGEQRINLIAFPLMGMLAWNIAIYIFLFAKSVAGWFADRRRNPERETGDGTAVDAATGGIARLLARFSHALKQHHSAPEPLTQGLARYSRDWVSFSSQLTLCRVRAILHLSAALFAVGLVGGMYARAFALEYLAGWESTFIDEYTLDRILNFILAPASAVTGIGVPGPASLARLRWSETQVGENAASWIHLYAVSALLFIVLPRLLLSLWSVIRAFSLSSNFPLPPAGDPYLRRLLAHVRSGGNTIKFIPYSYHPSDQARKNLLAMFAEVLGRKSQVEFSAPLAYGDEEQYLEKLSAGEEGTADYLIALFNLSATPESENQGALVEGLRAAARRKGSGQVLVLVDESAYRQRLAGQGGSEARLAERRLAWEQMLRNHGVRPVVLDLAAEDLSAGVRQLEALILHDHSRAS